MGAARLVAILLSLRPTLCLGLRVADGLGQHLAQLGLGLRRFARWCPLPCSHEQYVGMRSGELNPSNEGRDASMQRRRVRSIPIEALSLAITCKFGNIRAREAFEGAGMTMQTEALAGAEDYFLKVLKPNKEAFFATPSTFASALNLATSLFHFHEWLFGEFKTKLEAELGTTFHGKGSFWQAVENTNPKFGYMRDVTNASKHVAIGAGPNRTSTGMTHIANVHIISIGYGEGGYGQGRFGGGPNVVVDDGGSQISFDVCATELFDYWKALLEKLTGQNYL
jgi:hypothetical protein